MNGCVARSGLGSLEGVLPQKLLSSAVASEVCASVEPTWPNLYGFTPSFASSCRPVCSAVRAYSPCSISFFFVSLRLRLPLSQVSKLANSSFFDRKGCASPSPLICVVSYSGSQRMRVSAYSRVSGCLLAGLTSQGNIQPLERLPLCAMASTCPPVLSW